MIRRKAFALLLVSLVPALLLSCSSSSSPTTPGNGGAGAELSGSLSSTGSHYAHTFAKKGTFNYYCTIHPSCTSLQGTIVVVDSGTVIANKVLAITQDGGSAGGPYGGATCSSLSIQRDTVLVGEQITWTNNSPLPHTVTSH
jgi:hypothetical protein